MISIRHIYQQLLGHFYNKERSDSSADDDEDEAYYDDRRSMLPFIYKQENFESLSGNKTNKYENNEADHQRELVKWTKRLAYT
jgi:hypothetical protein